MTVTVKNKSALAVPAEVQRRAGIKPGDRVEFKVSGSIINIIPELPSADDEYTPEQRRIIDAQLKEGLAEIKAGRTHGPFASAKEASTYIGRIIRQRKATKRVKRPGR